MTAADEHPPKAMAAALRAMLRFFAVYVAFSVVELLGQGLRWLVVFTMEPGHSDSGPIAALLRIFRPDAGGETWAGLFLLITFAVVAIEAVMLLWALRPSADRISPTGWLCVGLAGLGARMVSNGMGFALSHVMAQRGIEELAMLGIAQSLSAAVHSALFHILTLAVLIVLFLRLTAIRRSAAAEQPE